MRFCLISTSSELRAAFESVAATIHSLDLVVVSQFDPEVTADVFVWDIAGDRAFAPQLTGDGQRHVVAVNSRAADKYGAVTGVTVLLKPVTPEALREVVSEAIEHGGNSNHTVHGEFAARAARELHAPLVALNGYCGLLLDRQVAGSLSPMQNDVVEQMHESVRHASRIADALWSAAARIEYDREDAFFEDCVAGAVRDVKAAIERRQIQIRLTQGIPQRAHSVPRRLRQALGAVLEYACASSSEGATLDVSASVVGVGDAEGRAGSSHAACRVDTKLGAASIPADEAKAAFADAEWNLARPERAGRFALAVAKRIVGVIGGSIHGETDAAGALTISVLVPNSARTVSITPAAGSDTFPRVGGQIEGER